MSLSPSVRQSVSCPPGAVSFEIFRSCFHVMRGRSERKSNIQFFVPRLQMSPEEFFTKVQHPAVELLTFIIEQEPVLFKLPEELIQDVIAFIRTEENDDDDQAVSLK